MSLGSALERSRCGSQSNVQIPETIRPRGGPAGGYTMMPFFLHFSRMREPQVLFAQSSEL